MTFANVHPDSWTLKYFDGANWVDITSDCIINPFNVLWGFADNHPETRIANTGQMTFTLNNILAKYIPEAGSPATGWHKGTLVQLTVTYFLASFIRFRGRIDTLTPHNEPDQPLTVDVSCLDWLDNASKYPLLSPQVAADIDAGFAINTIIAAMPIKPLAQNIDIGNVSFPSLFDAVSVRTTAYEEFSKLANSEWGYVYLQHDKFGGETLVFENNTHRTGLNTLSKIPKLTSLEGFLLKANSPTDYILKANSATDKIIPNLVDSAILTNISKVEETNAENIVNRITVNVYPKWIDTAPVVLYKLGHTPLKISSGATKHIRGKYSNPNGGGDISGLDMIAPVATTDYTMNTKSNGKGIDITANLVIVCTYDSIGPKYDLHNTYTALGYVRTLTARGFGIYQDDAISSILENTTSENLYGYQDLTIDQVYQQDIDTGTIFGNKILDDNRKPHTRVNTITFDANYSIDTMWLFLNSDIGSLVQVIDAQYGINDWFYVQGINFTLDQVGHIIVTWIVKKMRSINSGSLTPLAVDFLAATADALDFGSLPSLSGLNEITISFWMDIAGATATHYILSALDALTGFRVVYNEAANKLTFSNNGFSNSGRWYITADISVALIHVVITIRLAQMIAPIIYVGASPQALTTDQAPSGDYYSPADGLSFILGATRNTTGAYVSNFTGQLKDVRLYNRILSQAEVTMLYNGGTPDTTLVPDGLIFQGPCVRTVELTDYVGVTLTTDLKVLDNAYGLVGDPAGSPVGRAF